MQSEEKIRKVLGMERAVENMIANSKPSTGFREMGNRSPLTSIENLMEAPLPYPSPVTKKKLIERFAASLVKKEQLPPVARPPTSISSVPIYHGADHHSICDSPFPMAEELEDMMLTEEEIQMDNIENSSMDIDSAEVLDNVLEMKRIDENMRVNSKPSTGFREMGNRSPLTSIENLMEAPLPYPNPVTKKQLIERFAASLVKKEQRPPVASPPTSISSMAIYHEADHYSVCDSPFPMAEELEDMMLVEQDITMNDIDNTSMDIDCVEELYNTYRNIEKWDVDMKDASEDNTFTNIDGADAKSLLKVVDYGEEIYNNFRNIEETTCMDPGYMAMQSDINQNMRAILIDWLIEVHYKFDLMDETLYLTVNIIDRFLQRQTVLRKNLLLVGVTALLLACKYEEVTVPVVEDLVLISDHAYKRKEILDMEWLMLKTLQFNMSVPTPYVFMKRFLQAAQSDRQMELLSFFLMELCLVDYDMLRYRPSLLAAAAIYTAQCSLKGCKLWTKTCQFHSTYSEDQLLAFSRDASRGQRLVSSDSTYSEDQLLECSRLMVDLQRNAGTGKLTRVHSKYSTYEYGCAAKCDPALFLLE